MHGVTVARILDALPQTQCTRCGYPDCAGYAQAIVDGAATINQCPPGGDEGVIRLATLTGLPHQPLALEFGTEGPRSVAFIDENWCIGCTLCIDACPTDAIVGSNKRMHTVIEDHCTGCELCLPVCPVDCILLENASAQATGWQAWSVEQADTARKRYEFHSLRRTRDEGEQAKRLEEKAEAKLADLPAHSQHTDPAVLDKKRAVIEAALARARAKRATPS
ncbi:electron transport complex subunit RsxB [Rhodoferax saidenbachensis]|uniref:Ferredoxin n=1 Tax=Rhodoferax saidenbachensis TaxID=1484693 RepID=A0A1P8KAY3_9BURK|nr:electron transport complex subunit RsxB [Rhodoferax saidenbachensis]APW43158.1 ferredoxin [Rhodoferax saidenbachensis]